MKFQQQTFIVYFDNQGFFIYTTSLSFDWTMKQKKNIGIKRISARIKYLGDKVDLIPTEVGQIVTSRYYN